MMTRAQGYVAIVMLLVIAALMGWPSPPPARVKWEYHVLSCAASASETAIDGADRTGKDAFKQTAVQIPAGDLAVLGAEGWELVGTFLELETAFPNFGKDEYVTGLQTNTRPQRAVLVFKRPALRGGVRP